MFGRSSATAMVSTIPEKQLDKSTTFHRSPTGDQNLSDEQPDECEQDTKGGVKQIDCHATLSAGFLFSRQRESQNPWLVQCRFGDGSRRAFALMMPTFVAGHTQLLPAVDSRPEKTSPLIRIG